jgi:hypothetical protein
MMADRLAGDDDDALLPPLPPPTVAKLRAAAARCRRLAGTIIIPDEPALRRLLDLADEYDARASALERSAAGPEGV